MGYVFAALVALTVIIPPAPPGWRWGQASWEREVKRCAGKTTAYEQQRCLRGIYK